MSDRPKGSRYARQAALDIIGPEGQQRLAVAKVSIVGCGALGSAQADLLARAGVGTLRLVDRDILELHNLQRQQLYDENDVAERLPKAVAAARRLRAINSDITIEEHIADVTADNVNELIDGIDVLVDGTDNFDTRYLLNDAAVRAGVPWVYGGVLGTEGTVLAVRPGTGPCLRCLFGEPPDGSGMPTCETYGVLGAAVSWVAALQVTETLKLLVGSAPEGNEATLYSLDIWSGALYPTRAQRSEGCPCCQERRFDFLDERRGAQSTSLCGRNAVQVSPDRPRAAPLDLQALGDNLEAHGELRDSGMLLELTLGETSGHQGKRLVIFPDGRVLVMGTTDTAEARALVARFVGA